MFRKLVSNLPFNPSLLDNLSFYAKRVKDEESLRRLGFGFVALAMFIQIFAVIVPPESTLAASNNDIIKGGFQTKDQAVAHCLNTGIDFGRILNHLGISCSDVANSQVKTIKSTDHGGQLYSMGRFARGPLGKGNKPTDEFAMNISGNTYYMRRLASFDTWAHSSYKALVGTNSAGQTFMILFNCGNPVTIGRYAPPPPPQQTNNGVCEVLSNIKSLKAGEKFNATIRVRNSGNTSWDPNHGFRLGSQNPQDNLNWGTNRVYLHAAVAPGGVQDVTASFTAPHTPGTYQFSWMILQEGVQWFGASCSSPIIITALPAPKPEPKPEPKPQPDACPEVPGIQTDASECLPCDDSTNQHDIASCLQLSKRASNVTQGITDANGTTAAAGDEIKYTLSVTNSGNKELKDFVFEEILADVLEYADIKEYGGAQFKKDAHKLVWPAVTIGSGVTEERTFTVKVKDKIPQTPVSASDPGSYDLTMSNVFHDVTINIHLPPGVAKTTEQVVTTLPSTGPGSSLVIGFVATTIIAYFFARSRLMSEELEIIRSDFAQTGGI